MNFAVPYYHGKKGMNDKAQEFNLDFYKNSDKDKMIEFIELFPNKQINISFWDGIDLKAAKVFSRFSENVSFCLTEKDKKWTELPLNTEGIHSYFFNSDYPATSWTKLEYMVEFLGVREIYIADDLIHDLPKVSKYCREHRVKMRIVLNLPQSTIKQVTIKSYIPRPEDFDYLSQFFNVFEFDTYQENPQQSKRIYNFDKAKILYQIFVEDKEWFFQMSDFNDDAPSIKNNTIVPEFAKWITTCGLRCLTSNCEVCDATVNLSNILREKNLIIEKDIGQKD